MLRQVWMSIARKAGPWLIHHLALTIPFRVHRLHDLHGPSAINAASEEWPGSGRSESVTVGRPGAGQMNPHDVSIWSKAYRGHYRIFGTFWLSSEGGDAKCSADSLSPVLILSVAFFSSLLSKTRAANPLHKAGSVSFKQCRDSQAGNSRQPGSPTLRHPNHPVCCPQPGEMEWNESTKKWVRPDMG